jgi:Na+/proline symporter
LQDLDYTFSYFENNIEQKNILPATGDTIAWFSFMVFLGVQWWSSNLFDGGGPEMSRFTAVKSKRSAILAGLTPILLFFVLSFLLLFQVLVILGLSGDQGVEETHYVEGVFQIIPEPFQGLVLIGFFTMFLTSSEALMNWGASFLAVDVYKGYISPEVSAKKLRKISFLIMLFISLVATLFAFQINSLQGLVKIAFSIAAGVAPVYILRWVWYRINAWSQISAMISSAFFTLIYSSFHDITPLQDFPMEETRIVFVTTSTSIIWIAITFLSKDQRRVTKEIMSKIIVSPKAFLLRLGFAILLGIILMVITASLWFYFLFW